MLGLLAIHLENDEVSLYFALYVQINSRHTKETNVKTNKSTRRKYRILLLAQN